MPYHLWIERWQKTIDAVRGAGGSCDEIRIGPPAREAEIAATEKAIGRQVPTSLRTFLLEFSGSVRVSWTLYGAKERLGGTFAGDVQIGLRELEEAERFRRKECRTLAARPRIPAEPLARWRRSLAWWYLDGSAVAFQMPTGSRDAPVVTLENEACWDDESAWLAPDFFEFMDRWTRIGSVRPLWWMLESFMKKPSGGLDPDGAYACAWREALGVEL